MTTIDQVINRQPSQTSTKSSSNREAVEAFKSDFPTAAVIADFFTAKNWPIALEYTEQMLTRPCIPLAGLDEAYHTDGLALQIVKAQFVGIHQISGSREPAPKSADLAAKMFIGKYGQTCTPFDMMVYFANYPLDYKTTFAMYDVQDILAQYAKKYLVWKRTQRQEQPQAEEEEEQQQASGKPVGYEAFLLFAAEQTPEYLRESPTYRIGFKPMIERAIKELTCREPF